MPVPQVSRHLQLGKHHSQLFALSRNMSQDTKISFLALLPSSGRSTGLLIFVELRDNLLVDVTFDRSGLNLLDVDPGLAHLVELDRPAVDVADCDALARGLLSLQESGNNSVVDGLVSQVGDFSNLGRLGLLHRNDWGFNNWGHN